MADSDHVSTLDLATSGGLMADGRRRPVVSRRWVTNPSTDTDAATSGPPRLRRRLAAVAGLLVLSPICAEYLSG